MKENGGLVAAFLFGLILISATTGFGIATLRAPIAVRNTTNTPPSCGPAGNDRSSELCAQWSAATAAREANAIARNSGYWTIAGFVALVLTLLATAKASAAASRAAKAAEESVDVSEDTAKRQLRAYVYPSNAWLEITEDGNVTAHVHVRNYGTTPAHNERHWISIWVECFPLHDPLPDAPEDFEMGNAVLGPGGHNEMVHPRPNPLNAQSEELIRADQAAIYVYGKITYDDIYGERHASRYIYFCSGNRSFNEGRLSAYREGNVYD